MARTAILRGILDKVFPVVKPTNTWSVIKVEKMLKDAGISKYEFDYETKCVCLASKDDLMEIIIRLMPSEITQDQDVVISKFNGAAELRIGNWKFKVQN
ncbi:MAG: hypothetical protein K6T91_06270 [Firmicutes bacterium]|nr:hypothetical protein [Bacillota bacterium]